jgi:hypothetical protein
MVHGLEQYAHFLSKKLLALNVMERPELKEEPDWNAWPDRKSGHIAEEQATQGRFYSSLIPLIIGLRPPL